MSGAVDGSRAGFETARLALARLRMDGDDARQSAMQTLARASAPTRSPSNGSASGCSRTAAASFAASVCTGRGSRRPPHRASRSRPPPTPVTSPRSRTGGSWAITDTRTHAVARELAGSAFTLTGTTARLDAPIIREGVVAGVVCYEHVGEARIWSQKDRDFAASTADMAALFLEQADRLEIELALRERRESKLVEDKMAALGRLARAVAHDINNVFNALGMTGFLLEASEDEASTATASDPARGGSGRPAGPAAGAVRGGGLDSDARVDLGAVVDRMRPVLTDLAHGIRLEIAMLTPAPVIVANASQIEQVVLNLCVNAFESITPGAGRARPRRAAGSAPGEAIIRRRW